MTASGTFTILLVDDNTTNLQILRETLDGLGYKLLVAKNGKSALTIANKALPDLVLLDVMMPEIDGYEVCRQLKQDASTRHIPVIFVTAMTGDEDEAKGLALGAVDYITKPINPELVRARVCNQLELVKYRSQLENLVSEKTRDLALTQAVLIESLATLAEYRDPETGGHIKRTQNYVKALAMQLRNRGRYREALSDHNVEMLYLSAPLHDMGKVGVRDSILLKEGKLTDDEFEEMKQHTVFGNKALKQTEQKLKDNTFLRYARLIAYTHQEKWDGSGYPQGLKGEAIPLPGRLMALADVYDALISKRVYKPPMPHDQAVKIITDGSGTHFDPDVVDAFLAIENTFRNIARTYADHEEEHEALALENDDRHNGSHRIEDVLLVEDSAINLEIMRSQLSALGYRVETAVNGKAALDKVNTRRFDVILTDLEMPVMDGYALVEAVRRSPRDAEHPILILAITASEYDLTEKNARSMGFDGFMLKPLDPELLQKKIATIKLEE